MSDTTRVVIALDPGSFGELALYVGLAALMVLIVAAFFGIRIGNTKEE